MLSKRCKEKQITHIHSFIVRADDDDDVKTWEKFSYSELVEKNKTLFPVQNLKNFEFFKRFHIPTSISEHLKSTAIRHQK